MIPWVDSASSPGYVFSLKEEKKMALDREAAKKVLAHIDRDELARQSIGAKGPEPGTS